MKADPKKSEGARAERRAFRSYLRRQLANTDATSSYGVVLTAMLNWVLDRQKRYDTRKGGLGK